MFDDFQEIFTTLKKNKLRTFLTGFSMAWGIFMLIVLLGAGNGIRNGILFNFADMATNFVKLWPGRTAQAYGGLQAGRRIKLDSTDGPYLEKEFSQVYNVSPLISRWGRNFYYQNEYAPGVLQGVLPGYSNIESVEIRPGNGRFINQADIRLARKVIVLHSRTAGLLFKDKDPLGKHITYDNVSYKVVGVYHDTNMSQNPNSCIPLTTAQLIYNPENGYSQVAMLLDGMDTKALNEVFEKDLRSSMGRKHRFEKEDQSAIYLYNVTREFIQFRGIFNGITLFVWIIGLGTLIAGVVGISNIMLITVKERTKEFGIRKAIGATPGTILRLVLTECLMITAFFGYLGMLAGIAVTELLNHVVGTPDLPASQEDMVLFANPTVDPVIIIAATLVLIAAGLMAGYLPARRAVQVKPIEALRYE
ncbi:MAG TPA: ABC transporter permease [Bacteroidales bacterium]|jgi:putative ABC transport system permease protein|nr:ABC transporter permease [Bacteroidales bacterium]OQC57046.1 MAG: Macrolide export ATP-binding/permease protein MacB [Bacteroidetes bacterium ADurb.Bin013]MBV6456412.1 Macrolide export ATP-binding/permease protein MacB [Bacteroidales bacterium]NLZ09226.1 ABC transporter permease [Bacteroidales bacterium]HNR27918.1 ABC transporter permease [Bacteroidales bacterium]